MSPATLAELFRRFFSVLEPLGIDYFAYGGVSVAPGISSVPNPPGPGPFGSAPNRI